MRVDTGSNLRDFHAVVSRTVVQAAGLALALAFGLAAGGCSSSSDGPSSDPTAASGADASAEATPPEAGTKGAAPADDDAPGESAGAGAAAKPAPPPYEPRPEDLITPHEPIENPENLAYFFDALARVDAGEKEVVRVVHMGASLIGNDDMTSSLRTRFQTRFGDGGAGLVLMQRYMPNYIHRGVKMRASGWKHCFLAYLCMKDGHYGIGGTTFWAHSGATTVLETKTQNPDDEHPLGHEAAHFEVWYAARKGGGRLDVTLDDGDPITIETRDEDVEDIEDRFWETDLPRGPHEIRVRARGHGNSRTYGVVMETDGPGIVWDQFSKLGVFTNRVLAWDPEHLAGQIAHRDPDLIVFTYGGNDTRRIANGKLDGEGYGEELGEVIDHMRAGKPEASCLVMSIIDKGKSLNFDIEPEHVEVIVEAQRRVARQKGCAFWDLYHAMGGGGSLKAWKKMSPPLAAADLKHLSHRGYVKVAGWLYDAIVAGYVEHRRSRAR